MARSVGSWLVGSVLLSSLGGCYASHTADEELLDLEFPEEVYPADAGAAADAARNKCDLADPIQRAICQFTQGAQRPGNGNGNGNGQCNQTDPIQKAICEFSQGAGGGTGGTGGIPGLDIGTIIDLLGGGAGGGGTGTPSLEDLLGGGGDNGLPSLEDLLGGGAGGTGGLPSLEDILAGLPQLGRRDAGAPQPQPVVDAGSPRPQLTAEQCAAATDTATRFLCALSGFQTPSVFPRRDGGSLFPRPPTRDAGVVAPAPEPEDAGFEAADAEVDAGTPVFVF
jgi:hypothetical protein